MPTTTIVVEVDPDGQGLVDLVHSIDRQTAPSTDFETIFAGIAERSPVGPRLADLAVRRPNVRVSAGGTREAVAEAAGDWVLHVPAGLCAAGARLQPEAVARLTAFAVGSDCDAVLGRVDVAAGTRAHDLLLGDGPRLSDVPAGALEPGLVLYRRTFASEHGLGADAEASAALLAGASVGVAGRYPAVLVPGPGEPAGALTVGDVCASWQDGVAVVTASGQAGAGPADRRVVWSIRHAGPGLELVLDGTGTVAADGTFSGTVRIDPRSAALGAELARGSWQVRVGVHGPTGGWSPRVPVPATALGEAVLDGLLVAVDPKARALTLDVGATRSSVVGRLAPDDVTIVETAQGTRMTAAVRGLAITGTSRTPGRVVVGDFPLPATLETDGGQAHVVCLLSGLPGRAALATRFGGRARPSGLDLVIDGVGQMSVAPTPPPAPKPAPSAKRPTAAPARPPSPVARLRRAVPAPLQPAVRKLSYNSTARRVYRRLTAIGRG